MHLLLLTQALAQDARLSQDVAFDLQRYQSALKVARTGRQLMTIGGGVFGAGAALALGMGLQESDENAGLVNAGFMVAGSGWALVLVGDGMLGFGSLSAGKRAQNMGFELDRTAAWVSVGLFGATFILPELYYSSPDAMLAPAVLLYTGCLVGSIVSGNIALNDAEASGGGFRTSVLVLPNGGMLQVVF